MARPGWSFGSLGNILSSAYNYAVGLLYGSSSSVTPQPPAVVVQSRYPDLTDRQVRMAITTARDATVAAGILGRGYGAFKLTRETIPIDRSLPAGTAYQTRVRVKVIDTITGQEYYREAFVDTSRNPNNELILARGSFAGLQNLLQSPPKNPSGQAIIHDKYAATEVQIMSIFRRT